MPVTALATFDDFKGAVIGQESGGHYGVPNAQGSGAMGLGQVMPATAQSLAARIGLPYRPDLMGGTDASSRQYQSQITDAALQDAWKAGGQDPRSAAEYYFAGPNQALHGPKTHAYGDAILSRMAG